jgi:hypothetical protein
MKLAWGSINFTQDKCLVFEVRDGQRGPVTRAPGYAPE